MAQFPVSDDNSLQDAVNYLLSGPSGLGQFFKGFSAYTPGWLTGNNRIPYNSITSVPTYVAPISLGTCEMLDTYNWKFYFASTQPSAPFQPGNPVTISGVTDPYYDGDYNIIGVVDCTTTYVILKTNNSYPVVAPSSGGTAEMSIMDRESSTDCNAKVVVTGATDRVFISAQLVNLISYDCTGPSDLTYTVRINRYKGEITDDVTNPVYRFNFDKLLSERIYNIYGLTGSGVLDEIETVFTSIIDEPDPAYYFYVLEVLFESPDSTFQITSNELKLRSLTAQVVKE